MPFPERGRIGTRRAVRPGGGQPFFDKVAGSGSDGIGLRRCGAVNFEVAQSFVGQAVTGTGCRELDQHIVRGDAPDGGRFAFVVESFTRPDGRHGDGR